MKAEQFSNLKNFNYDDMVKHFRSKGFNLDDAERMVDEVEYDLMYRLQKVVVIINSPIIITCLVEGNHRAGSYHYHGIAADWYCKDTRVHPNKILQACLTVGFRGIGWYPERKWPGFHTDIGDREEIRVYKKIDGWYKPLIEGLSG